MDVRIYNWPQRISARLTGAAINLNFFSNHFITDLRYAIGVFILYFFRRSVVSFRIEQTIYRMPTILSFLLIGFFIWLAENMATLLGAWKYAYQHNNWQMVDLQKISSWFFLVIVSYIIVAELKMLKSKPHPNPSPRERGFDLKAFSEPSPLERAG